MAATDERRRGPDVRIAQCSPKLGRFRAAAKVRSRCAERNLWQGRRGCDVEDRSRQHGALMDRNRGLPGGLELPAGEIARLRGTANLVEAPRSAPTPQLGSVFAVGRSTIGPYLSELQLDQQE